MKPIHFPEVTKELQRPSSMTDEQCGPLPVYNDGQVSISCWHMTLVERLRVLWTGRMWLGVHMGITQPPVWLDTKRPFAPPVKRYLDSIGRSVFGS